MHISLADSLRHLIADKDSTIMTLARREIIVNVAPARVALESHRDAFDWLTLGVSMLVGLGAAWLGAKIGGEESRKAAILGQEREAADARRLRAEERREYEGRERALLLRRLERDLTTAGGIVDSLALTNQITPIMPVAAANLAAMWDSFVRRRDAVMLLADPDTEHEIEVFYEWAFSRGALFHTWLETEMMLMSVGNPNVAEIQRRAAVAEDDVRNHVERTRNCLPRLREVVARLAAPPAEQRISS